MEHNGSERRRHVRRPISMRVKYRTLDTFFYDYALNISKGGIFIKTRQPLARGSDVEVEFEIPDTPHAILAQGRVVRVVFPGEDEYEPAGMGIEFEPLGKEDLEMMEALWKKSAEAGEA